MTDTAATIWTPKSGNGEYSASSSANLVDNNSNQLVDASGNSLVSSDSAFTQEPATTWSTSDGS